MNRRDFIKAMAVFSVATVVPLPSIRNDRAFPSLELPFATNAAQAQRLAKSQIEDIYHNPIIVAATSTGLKNQYLHLGLLITGKHKIRGISLDGRNVFFKGSHPQSQEFARHVRLNAKTVELLCGSPEEKYGNLARLVLKWSPELWPNGIPQMKMIT